MVQLVTDEGIMWEVRGRFALHQGGDFYSMNSHTIAATKLEVSFVGLSLNLEAQLFIYSISRLIVDSCSLGAELPI